MKLAGHKLRVHRKAQEPPLTQGELGARFGYTAMTISRFETGKADPPLSFMRAVAKAGIADLDDWLVEIRGEMAGPEPLEADA